MERIRYPLRHPIESKLGEADATITELHLAPRVKGRHMRATDPARGAMEAKLLLISSLAGIGRAEADELDQEDVDAIDALYAGPTDLDRIGELLDLPAGTSPEAIMAAIRTLRGRGLDVPLDGGAGPSAAGPATGGGSSAT